MPFELRYHPDVKSIDIPLLDAKLRTRIKNAIERRLTTAPHLYGEPLRKTLRGYWKLRVGDYRGGLQDRGRRGLDTRDYSQKEGL